MNPRMICRAIATATWMTGVACVTPFSPAAPVNAPDLFRPDNLLAWCVVPFDAQKRGPAERGAMLQRLGFTQYAWDWRSEHLPHLAEEIRLAGELGIRLRAIWLWIDRDADGLGRLGRDNQFVIDTVRAAGVPVEFWVGFHDNYFAGFNDDERLQRATAMVRFLRDETGKAGATIALYNHGGWFGEPENQLAIIVAVGAGDVGLVFNFHHAHDMTGRFAALLPRLLPHLRAVNLNGMIPGGPKVVPVGAGSHERAMIRVLRDSGYRGPIGLLGHVDDDDVEVVLRRNLEGLRQVARELESST